MADSPILPVSPIGSAGAVRRPRGRPAARTAGAAAAGLGDFVILTDRELVRPGGS